MYKIFKIIFCLCLIYFNGITFAEDKPNLNVSLIPDSGTNDTKFIIQVTVAGEEVSSIETPIFYDNENFTVALSSNSIQEQIINGVSTQQKTYVFSLTPKSYLKEGEYNAPNGTITYRGTKYRLPTKNIHIETAKAFIGSVLKAPEQDGFNFIQLMSNEKPYVGEQVSYRVEIIAPNNLLKAELEDFEVEGVWREKFGQEEKKQRQAYNLTIHSFSEAWFPVRSGVINVPERTLHVALQQVRRVPSGMGLSGQLLGSLLPLISQFSTEEKAIVASPILFEVQALPPPPSGTLGYIPVGTLKISSSIDRKESQVGEPIVLTIQVSGDANLKPLEIGKPLEKLQDNELRRYDEKPILKKVINNPEVYFYKTFSLTFIPLINGNVKIPQFKITWFDPKEKTYKTDITTEGTVSVAGEPVKIPNREENGTSEVDYNFLLQKYSGKSYGFNPNYALLLFILSFSLPLLRYTYLAIRKYFIRRGDSAKIQLTSLLSKTKKITSIPSIEALQILKNASTIYLNFDAIPLTGSEIASCLELRKEEFKEHTSILKELEEVIYSKHTVLSEQQRTNVINLIKAMHELL